MNKYYIVSIKHTHKADQYISLWRPDNAGYCYSLEWAGKYDEALIREKPDYYNNLEDSFPVPIAVAQSIAIPPEHGNITGPVIQNNRENWRRLKRSWVDMVAIPQLVVV